jgi:Asp-tRNA(Asn)/Glu-tRNA(Gln) amidotransferase A subunit family amidase
MSKLNELTATEAAAGLANGDFSATDLMRACLDRVAEREDDVRAWAYIDPEQAMAQAREADAIRARGGVLGPLHGLPIGIKDIIDTQDMPTDNGSALFDGRRPNRDAGCVAALRAAGAIIMGKTVTTELANTNPSKTRNPHNLEHTPGGSSAGSGAGVADFHMPLALGTQTGGSVIRPASFNGVYGLKPTLGLIPRNGVLLQSHTLDTVGVYGRSLDDLALITDSLSIADPSDQQSYHGSRGTIRDALKPSASTTPRFAFVETPAWDLADEGAKKAIEGVAASLGNACEKETPPSPFDQILVLHGAIFAAENAHYYGAYLRERPELLSDKIRTRLAATYDLPARDYINALNEREVIYSSIEALLERYDAILCLPATGPAPHGFETTGNAAFNSPWTYLGVPCVSIPRLTVDGLPLGVQLVGARGAEGRLMRTARWLDEYLISKAS